MNRRDFLMAGAGGLVAALAGCETLSEEQAITKRKFAGLKVLGPTMPLAEVREGALSGRNAFHYVDDVIWIFRDLARQRPKSIFDHPFFGGFRKVHEATGLKVQFNLFYRRSFRTGTTSVFCRRGNPRRPSTREMPIPRRSRLRSAATITSPGM